VAGEKFVTRLVVYRERRSDETPTDAGRRGVARTNRGFRSVDFRAGFTGGGCSLPIFR